MIKVEPLYNMRKLSIKYSRRLDINIGYLISKFFPNLKELRLISAPAGLTDMKFLGQKYLPTLEILDMSGDSYLSQKCLSDLSLCMP
jgi:hypothetical protein